MEETSEHFKDLKRNRAGGIEGVLINDKYPNGVKYSLDPALGHIEKAEAGEWGDILPLNQSDLDFISGQEAKTKQVEINDNYNQKIIAIIGRIPQYEIDTWPKQEAQALAWQADNNAVVPFIQNLAEERGLELADLVVRILAKAAAFEDLSSKALGQKHAAEDAL